MKDIKKNERVVQLLVELLKRPRKAFSVSELMLLLNLPENERRNLQRDVNCLMEMPDKLVICEGRGPCKRYRTGLNVLDKLTLPGFEDVMLQFVFLQNVADMYPGTADLIYELIEKIKKNLPCSQRDKVDEAYKEIRSRVFFMGGPAKIDENAGEKLHTILQAIRTHHEVCTYYKPSNGEMKKDNRIPIGIVIFLNEIYVACVRHNMPKAVFAIRLNRIDSVEIAGEIFYENNETLDLLEEKVKDISLFNAPQNGVERVYLTFPSDKKAFIEEHPFHQSMQIKEKDGLLHVTMDVNISLQLKQWLLFHTENGVTVVKPDLLRESLRKIGLELAEKYR